MSEMPKEFEDPDRWTGSWYEFEWSSNGGVRVFVPGVDDDADMIRVLEGSKFIRVYKKDESSFYLNAQQVLAFRPVPR